MGLSAAVLITAASSCVDNAYDLSDIDTTSRFNAKDLVIPMNIDQTKSLLTKFLTLTMTVK